MATKLKTRRGVYLITGGLDELPATQFAYGRVGVCEGRPFGIYHDYDEEREAFRGTDLITGMCITRECDSHEHVEAEIAERMPRVIEEIARSLPGTLRYRAMKAVENALDQMVARCIITLSEGTEYLRTGRLPFRASDVRRRNGCSWNGRDYLPIYRATIRRIAVIPDQATPNLCGGA